MEMGICGALSAGVVEMFRGEVENGRISSWAGWKVFVV